MKEYLPTQHRKGFTLLELLVVTSIIGVLASLLLTGISKAKPRIMDFQCKNNQRNIHYGMRSALTDVIPDESIHWNHDEEAEIQSVFYEEYTKPLIGDKLFKDLGVVISKPLTCPYAMSKGDIRATFDIHWLKYLSKRPNLGKDVQAITGTYSFPINTPNEGYWDRTKAPAVECEWNIFKPREITLGEYFNVPGHRDKNISVGTTMMHPHKGKGKHVTYWSGSQKWIPWKESMMRVDSEE